MTRIGKGILTGLMVVSGAACAAPSTFVGEAPGRVIYDSDDRVEVVDLDIDDPARGVALDAVAALVPVELLRPVDAGLETHGATWGEEQNLCADVRFADQPVIAHCTAVLIGEDMMLTAGHCARLCSVTRVVFGAHLDADGVMPTIPATDAFDCVDVVTEEDAPGGPDIAWLRLDRPVGASRRPAVLRTTPPALGEALALVSFPGGVPMKADRGGVVVEVSDDVFTSSHDAFQSSSGGPLIDAFGSVMGILGGGAPDLLQTPEGCAVPAVLPGSEAREQSTTAEAAVAALCAASPCDPVCAEHAGSGRETCGEQAALASCALGDRALSARWPWPWLWLTLVVGWWTRRRAGVARPAAA